MTFTLLGRLQTKALTYPLLGLVTAAFAYSGGSIYVWAMAVTIVVGLILETLWGIMVEYQPGWLTILFGVIEFLAVVNIAVWFGVPMTMTAALVYYATAWSIIQLFLIYLLPVWYTCWGENGGELW